MMCYVFRKKSHTNLHNMLVFQGNSLRFRWNHTRVISSAKSKIKWQHFFFEHSVHCPLIQCQNHFFWIAYVKSIHFLSLRPLKCDSCRRALPLNKAARVIWQWGHVRLPVRKHSLVVAAAARLIIITRVMQHLISRDRFDLPRRSFWFARALSDFVVVVVALQHTYEPHYRVIIQ